MFMTLELQDKTSSFALNLLSLTTVLFLENIFLVTLQSISLNLIPQKISLHGTFYAKPSLISVTR